MEKIVITKFGGSILSNGSDYSRIADHVKNLTEQGIGTVVVVSAMKNVTNSLIKLISNPVQYRAILSWIKEKYELALKDACNGGCKEELYEAFKELVTELERVAWAIGVLGEVSPKVKDYILSFGERLSSIVMCAALSSKEVPCEPLSGFDAGIVTDDNFGEARPIHEISSRLSRAKILPLLRAGKVPVVTGFIGGTLDGAITTLGRGGSDYTATLLAKYLGAEEVRLYTNTPGILAADPRFVSNARIVSKLSFKEAMELAYLGAKKFHPRTFEPLLGTGIRVKVTSIDKSGGGTVIDDVGGPPPLKAVVALTDLALVSVEGAGMVGRLGTAAEIMRTASASGVNIIGIAQPVSEVSITLVVRGKDADNLVSALKGLRDGFVRNVDVRRNVSAVIVVGEGLRNMETLRDVLSRAINNRAKLMLWYVGDSSVTLVAESDVIGEIVRSLYEEVIRNG